MMKNSTKEHIADFLSKVESELGIPLRNQGKRFFNVANLLNRFQNIRDVEKQLESGNESFVNQIIEITNELCIAKWLLDPKNKCNELTYEPVSSAKATASRKTIDFCAFMENGQTIYFDVKTIQPDTIDRWDKFEEAIKENRFPENVNMILDKESLGGEIWHDSFSSRGRMLEYTVELEEKIRNYEIKDKTDFVMVFCGDGFDWRVDKLEDFADFYKTGRYNPDDPFREMESYSIKKKQIKLQENITAFYYLERPKTEIKIAKLICPVQGPWVANRWYRADEPIRRFK